MGWHLRRILPFGVIYLLTTWVFLLVEIAVYKSSESSDYTVVTLNFQMLLFISAVSFAVGFLVGLVETTLFNRLFKNRPLFLKIGFKLICYIVGGFLLVMLFFPLTVSLDYGLPFWHKSVTNEVTAFLQNASFYSSLLQMAFTILLCLVYGAVADNLGHDVLVNFFTGKYHTAKDEERIFMFLDMKDSTTIAESMGHQEYFKLLQFYYDLMSDAIIEKQGQVYQYVGDEVVITWTQEDGVRGNSCINCFFAIKDNFRKNHERMKEKFGVVPDFKAGIHLGEVTTGEVGALKKEIVFTGDVLNTAARIQGECRTFNSDLLVSKELIDSLENIDGFKVREIGKIPLKGKNESVELFSIQPLNSE